MDFHSIRLWSFIFYYFKIIPKLLFSKHIFYKISKKKIFCKNIKAQGQFQSFGKTISFFSFCFVLFCYFLLHSNSTVKCQHNSNKNKKKVSTQLTFSELPHTAQIHTLSQCLEQSDKDYTELKNTEHLIMAAWTGAARHAVNFARLSSPKTPSTAQAASLIHRRGLAGGGGNLSFIRFCFL